MMTMLAPARWREEPEPITLIEYHRYRSGWKPFAVQAGNDHYDFDWCEQDELLAHHLSGSGGGETFTVNRFADAPKLCAKLWYDHSHVRLLGHDSKPMSDKEVQQLGYQVIKKPLGENPFDDPDAIEDKTEYCEQCKDRHPYESMCQHVKWADDGGGYHLGCGSTEIDFGKTQSSFYRILRMLSPEKIKQMLADALTGRLSVSENLLDIFDRQLNYEDRFWPGVAWLASLDKNCKQAMALTAGWLWIFQRHPWDAFSERRLSCHLTLRKLQEWFDLDPLAPDALWYRPLRMGLAFKAKTRNDITFQAAPEKCEEVSLFPPARTKRTGWKMANRGLTLSVAEVRRVSRRAVDIYFGAVIERNGQHVSEMGMPL